MKVTNRVRFTVREVNEAVGVAGWVYFVVCRDLNLLKIGWSEYPPRRLEQLRSGMPYPLDLVTAMAGSKVDEARLLKRYKEFRVSGEWFTFGTRLRSLVGRTLNRSGPAPWPSPIHYTDEEWELESAVRKGKASYINPDDDYEFRLSHAGVAEHRRSPHPSLRSGVNSGRRG